MTTSNRDAFLGMRQLPTCTHEPQVVLETAQLKACLECALACYRDLIGMIDVIFIRDGELNANAKALLLERGRPTSAETWSKAFQSGGRESY